MSRGACELSAIRLNELAAHIEAAVSKVRQHWPVAPDMGIILGTGLGKLAREIDGEAVIPYGELPAFPRATALGHAGQLVCGRLRGLPVVTMEGRFHIYEGYPAWQITLPVRVMHALGVRLLVISNAAGAVNPHYRVGDVMAIEDHINLMGTNPLIGTIRSTDFQSVRADHEFGTHGLKIRATSQFHPVESPDASFPAMSRPYDPALIDRARQIARKQHFTCHRGVYVALAGPNYETRAEYRFLRQIGGDVVGMSTAPEAIVAHQLGLRVLALSTVTNVCRPDALTRTDAAHILAAAAAAEPKLRAIMLGIAANERV
jgi:purine-nucleoside phosphorylase